jgi:hypothetical protein
LLVGWILGRTRVGGMVPIGAGFWRVHEADGSPMFGRSATPEAVGSRRTLREGGHYSDGRSAAAVGHHKPQSLQTGDRLCAPRDPFCGSGSS